jgi:flavin-dependent dehydrogenase
MREGIKSVIAITGIVGLLAAAPAAMAKDGDVIKRGSCSGASDWKLKLSPQDGKIEVEFEVDSNRVGQTWNVRITKDGTQIYSGTKVTQAPSGSFTVRKVTSNGAGDETIRARAVNAATGEACTGSATFTV